MRQENQEPNEEPSRGPARRSAPAADVTEAELSVLKALWRRGSAKIRELTDDLYPSGGTSQYATVQKLLERLEKKGCVERRQERRLNVFRPTVGREELISHRLRATAESLCEGSLTPLLTNLVGSAPLQAEDISALRELVDRLEEEGPRQ